MSGRINEQATDPTEMQADGINSLEEFTCNTCPSKDDCPYSWDYYNIDGDCLMEK